MPKRILKWPRWQQILLISSTIFVLASLFTMGKVFELSQDTNDSTKRLEEFAEDLKGIAQSNTELNKQNARELQILEEATSPESRRASDARLAAAIRQLDCNHQYTIQRAVELELPGNNVMSLECIEYFKVNPPPP